VVSSPTYNLSDYQLVYEPNSLEIRGWYNEWIDYNLDSEFEYDGEHNISVVIHSQAPEARTSSYYYLASDYVYYGYGDITRYGYNSSSMTAAPTTYGTTSYRPFMKINRDDMKSKAWEYPVDNDHALAWSYSEGYRGGSNTNMYTYYDYGAFEAQYSAPMLGNMPRTINKLRFFVMYRSGTIGGQSQRFKIYLKNDVPSSLAYGASCNQSVDTSDYTKVFDGTYTLAQRYGNFWVDFELDKPFYYDGSSNLYMLFVSNNGSYVYNYYYFFTFNNPSYSGRYTYSSYYPNWQYGTNYFPMCDFVGPADKSAVKVAKEEDEIITQHTYLTSSYYTYFPYYSNRYSATEFIIHKKDLNNMPQLLHNMAFLKYSLGSVGGYSTGKTKIPNVTIYLKNTIDSTLVTSCTATGTLRNGSRYSVGGPLDTSASSGYTRVWGRRDMPVTGQQNEYYILNFDQPFQYDGNKHLKVLITYDRGDANTLNNYNCFMTTYTYYSHGYVMRYITNASTWPTTSTNWNSYFSYRPYVIFNKESYGNSPVEIAPSRNRITKDAIELRHSNNGSVYAYGSTTSFYNSNSFATSYQNQCYVSEMLYTAAELGGRPRIIDKIAFMPYSYSGSSTSKPFDLYIKNTTTQGCLYYTTNTATTYDTYINFNGYTKVLENCTYIPKVDSIGKWVEFKLKEPFFYDGESDILVMYVPKATGSSNTNYYTWCTYQKFSYAFRYNTSTSYPGRYNSGTSYCPMIKFVGSEVPPRHTYKSSKVVQLTGRCPEGAPDVPIVGLKVSTKKPFAPYLNMNQIIFNGKKSLNANQVKYAKCYYTIEDKFSTEHQYGDKIEVTSSNINKLVFESDQPIEAKVVYFWLAYDLNEDVPAGSEIDASVVEFTLDYEGEKSTYSPDDYDPDGYKTVYPPLKDKVYTVGVDVGADFENLSLLALDFTELGAKQDITIQVLTDVSDTAVAYFGTNYFGDYNVTIVPGDDVESVTLTAGKKVEEPYISLYRCNNFSIQGDGRLTISAPKGAINVEHSDNFSVDGTGIRSASVDAKDAQGIVITSSNGITLTNNNISSCFNGINLTEAEKVAISGNIIGAATDTKACSHGIVMTDVSNADIDNNQFLNIYGSDESVGLYLTNAEDIRIINNTINGMGSKSGDIIGILFDNANKVDIYHNTVYIYPKSTSTEYSNSAILYNLTESKNINLCNNILYSNMLSGEIDAVMYTANTNISNPFNMLGGNIYYSAKAFAMDANASKYNFGDWKQVVSILGEGRNETNSYWYEDIDETGAHVFKLISTEDCHLDGPSISDKNFYVPSISAVSTDMDGEDRGSLTTAGSDHVAMEYKQIETDYPSNAYDPEREPISELSLCDNGKDELFLQYEQEFIKWVDEANRTYVPKTENLWVRIPFGKENMPGLYDTLNTNPAFHVLDGRIYSNELTYELSGNYRVYSRIGSNEFVSKDLAVTITKPVTILEQPTDTILACSNAGLINTIVELDGTYTKLQWEYRPDANSDWEDVSGNEDLELKLNTTDEEELHAIVGEYRLRIE
ncbi:MAG: hypothetical protein IJK61_07870, partial [Bacteroidetes bacterium]|nr:hypothetical protein [Bacteroidota bacterium]